MRRNIGYLAKFNITIHHGIARNAFHIVAEHDSAVNLGLHDDVDLFIEPMLLSLQHDIPFVLTLAEKFLVDAYLIFAIEVTMIFIGHFEGPCVLPGVF